MMRVYRYNPKYLEKSVVDWLDKAYRSCTYVDMHVSDVGYWDEVLWNKHLFLPHSVYLCSEYDAVCVLPRDAQATGRADSKHLYVYNPGECMTDVCGAVIFADRSVVDSGTYLQQDTGHWTKCEQ